MTDWLTPEERRQSKPVAVKINALIAHAAEADRRIAGLEAELAALRAELHAVSTASGRRMDGWRAAEHRALRAEAEVDRMRPVYEKAIARHAGFCGAGTMVTIDQAERALKKAALDAYRASERETTTCMHGTVGCGKNQSHSPKTCIEVSEQEASDD